MGEQQGDISVASGGLHACWQGKEGVLPPVGGGYELGSFLVKKGVVFAKWGFFGKTGGGGYFVCHRGVGGLFSPPDLYIFKNAQNDTWNSKLPPKIAHSGPLLMLQGLGSGTDLNYPVWGWSALATCGNAPSPQTGYTFSRPAQ